MPARHLHQHDRPGLTLVGDPLDGAEIQNVDVNGTPIVVPDIAPAPAAYDGQFIQMDVLSVVPAT